MKQWAEGSKETYFGPTDSTTIDYILTPTELLEQVTECKVLNNEALNCT